MTIDQYREQIYAGVVGKIIGVYLGRAVEGWTFENIHKTFGKIEYYVNESIGAPLIVPDDDISGTFTFYRALADNDFPQKITAKQIGDTWLNYIIEDKTILWWGGLSRSTEHTAYIRLASGIPAPESGSIKLNGQSMAEQIGAQIFIDTWAMTNPNDPDQAVAMAREAASVSHDGMAIDAACFLAAMESMAFVERDIQTLIHENLRYVKDSRLPQLIDGVINECLKTNNWRRVREWIALHHGYDKYPGNCPMATNHAVVLMALMLAGDDFQESISIATSVGWDTDCNAGNVGCLNGIRLGLTAIDQGAILRKPVADRMFVVSADGGECITDAVRETRKIITAATRLRNEIAEQPETRYGFEYPGSTQGFMPHPDTQINQAVTQVENALASKNEPGLLITYKGLASGTVGTVSVQTFIDPEPKGQKGTSYFEVIASPTLYPTQQVKVYIKTYADHNPNLRFFIDYYDKNEEITTQFGAYQSLKKGMNALEWLVPNTQGHPIYRLGIELTSQQRLDGEICLVSLDWSGAPKEFVMGKSMQLSPSLTPWTTSTLWMKSFVSSAQHLAPDYTTTLSVSHPKENGVLTIGTHDWRDYSVESIITFSQQNSAGLVARARGHRQYYAAVLQNGYAMIVKRKDDTTTTLRAAAFDYQIDETHTLKFYVQGDTLVFYINDVEIVRVSDGTYQSGGAGFVVDEGAILVDGLVVKQL